MRSVSLWRMWATLRMVVGPSAKQATAASVITVSLMAFMSTSMPRSGPPWTVMPGVALLDAAAHLFEHVHELHVALQRLSRVEPETVTRPPVMAAAAQKYDAAEASGSMAYSSAGRCMPSAATCEAYGLS